jgi:GT2 family glycosyltransferase
VGDDVALAYLHPNSVGHNFHSSLLKLVLWDSQKDQRLAQYLTMRSGSGGIVEARNNVVRQFLDDVEESVEWLFWLDADMGFAPDVLDRLLAEADATDRPMVGALCFAWKELEPDGFGGFHCAARPTIYHWIDQDDGHRRFVGLAEYPPNQLVPTAATGSACVLVHRSVIEAVDALDGEAYDRLRGTDGARLGEDISFCVKVAACGFPIHVHTGIQTNHLKELWVSEANLFAERIVARTASSA